MTDRAIVEAIERTSAAIAADPAKARSKGIPAVARLVGGLKCEVSGPNGEQVLTDMPPPMGGAASAPNPAWFLRGALASCAATVIAMRAAKLGVTLDTLEVSVESESDSRGILGIDPAVSAGLGALRMRVRIGGNASAQALREIVTWADAHSPVGCTLRSSPACPLEIDIT